MWDFHAEIIHRLSKKNIYKTYRAIVFYFYSIIFLKIGLTVAILVCFQYLFTDITLLIVLVKWQLLTLANILTNSAEIPSGPLALFTFSDLRVHWKLSATLKTSQKVYEVMFFDIEKYIYS